MKQIEKNVVRSFDLVKEDILDIYSQIRDLKNSYNYLTETLKKKDKEINLLKEFCLKTAEIKTIQPKLKFVASKNSTKYHQDLCAYAQNISKKNKVVFYSKRDASKGGFKACSCIK